MARPIPEVIKRRMEDLISSPSGVAKFVKIMSHLEKPEIYLMYFKELMDRTYGKADQSVDITTNEDPNRPTTEALVETIRVLREELRSIREGSSVAKE